MSLAEQANGTSNLAELIVRVAQREVAAFEELYALTITRVYGTVRRVLLDRTLSEDATQDVYVQLWFTAHKYNPDVGNPMTWLLRIGHRRAVDRVRAEQRFFGRNTKYEAQSWPGEQDPVPELLDRLVAGEAIGRCLGSLTAFQRESIHLAYYGGLTYTDVAKKLRVKPSTIKSRIRDGLLRLRTCLEKQGLDRHSL